MTTDSGISTGSRFKIAAPSTEFASIKSKVFSGFSEEAVKHEGLNSPGVINSAFPPMDAAKPLKRLIAASGDVDSTFIVNRVIDIP